jgi:hypothetical protein
MSLKAVEQTGQSATRGGTLSHAQERLWVLEQLHPGSAAQNVARGLRWAERIDREDLETTLNEVVQQHEILRTEFRVVDGGPVPIVLPSAPIRVNGVDLTPGAPRA